MRFVVASEGGSDEQAENNLSVAMLPGFSPAIEPKERSS